MSQPHSPWPGFGANERGAVAVYVTVILTVVFGIGALVVDLGRLAATQTELQSYADHLALAIAGELDGNGDALGRAATALARAEWRDTQTFADGDRVLSDADAAVRYLSGLPADDEAPVDPFVTTDPLRAAYVEVRVLPHGVGSWLAGAFNALTGHALPATITTGAVAVAGFSQYACDISPVMFCTSGPDHTPVPGRMIHLKSGNAWGPGAFGLLDANFDPDGPCGDPNQGANFYRCAVGIVEGVTRCFARRGVDIRPGQVTGAAAAGFNTRFDIYTGNLHNADRDPLFAPAPDVVKGVGPDKGGRCIQNLNQAAPYADSDPLPRDGCFGAGETCAGSRFGDGSWDKAGYLAANHQGASVAGTTRYELYLNELARAGTGRILPNGKAESGRPVCSNQTPASPDRRVVIAAGIDCSALPPGNASGVPVRQFVRMFLTEPIGTDADGDNTSLWVEEIGDARSQGEGAGTTGGFVHDVVQLYR
jgi:hypothetical protein